MAASLLPGLAEPRLARRARLAACAAALLPFLWSVPAMAQQTGNIRGTVTESGTNRGVVGAFVTVRGTQRTAVTDENGMFVLLNVPVGERTVRIEVLGFRSAERTVTVTAEQTATLEIGLTQTAINLDEIVITGTAGQTQKRAIGNSVTSIKAADLTEAAPIRTVQELLAARSPGLTLLSNSGEVGSSSRVRIRGASSLNAGNEPVVYVDGVRVLSGTLYGSSTVSGANALDAINPRDIESVEVIKGPAASTLYGAEAATGVIQIITKKGRAADGVKWSANMQFGQTDWNLDRPTVFWMCEPSHIANASQYPGCQGLDPNAPRAARLLTMSPLDMAQECLWTEECDPRPLRTGDVVEYGISARGGGDAYNFYVAGERSNESGVFVNNYSNRTGGRANFGFVPSQKLNFNVNFGFARTENQMPLNNNASNGILRNAMRARPSADPDWSPGFRNFSPEISNQYDNRRWMERTTIGVTTNYTPAPWFQSRLIIGLDRSDEIQQVFYRQDQTGRAPWGSVNATGVMDRDVHDRHNWTFDYSGTLSHQFAADYSSSFSAGMQYVVRKRETLAARGEGLVTDKLNLVSSAAVRTGGQGRSEQKSLGFYVQEQIGFRDRLYGTVAVRVDDNSAFGRDFSLVVYPKAMVAYVISDEPFFNIGGVDELKLRGAWGQAGNAPSPFSADRNLTTSVTAIGDAAVNQLRTSSFGNPDLKAETGQELELGFDASLFRGRLGLETTYYYQQTKDALMAVPVARSTGYSGSQLRNIGEIKNTGLEVLVNASPIVSSSVRWDATMTMNLTRNELVSFGGARDDISFGAFIATQRHREGYPLGGYWGVDVRRDNSGRPILDEDGNAIVADRCVWPPENAGDCEEIFVGPALPTREFGLSSTFTLFRNVRLFATADYKGGNYQWCAICSVRSRIDLNSWDVNNPDATPEELAVHRSLQSLAYIYKADFIKLREVSLTYTLPGRITNMLRVDQASITAAARNPWMWTAYKGGADPELIFDSGSEFSQTDYASPPQVRRLMFSLNLNF